MNDSLCEWKTLGELSNMDNYVSSHVGTKPAGDRDKPDPRVDLALTNDDSPGH